MDNENLWKNIPDRYKTARQNSNNQVKNGTKNYFILYKKSSVKV